MLTLASILAAVLVLAAAANIPFIRRKLVTDRVLALYRRILPDMSQTEKEAIDAGTVWWDGDLFSGRPDFDKLLAVQIGRASCRERASQSGQTVRVKEKGERRMRRPSATGHKCTSTHGSKGSCSTSKGRQEK